MRLAEKLAWSLATSGLLMIVVAVASDRTGTHAQTAGGEVNTHAPATWVLATLGVVFLINALALAAWVREQTIAIAAGGAHSAR
jgi:hypothetical protein